MSSKAKTDLIQQALDCLQEDVNNMVALIENRKHYSWLKYIRIWSYKE